MLHSAYDTLLSAPLWHTPKAWSLSSLLRRGVPIPFRLTFPPHHSTVIDPVARLSRSFDIALIQRYSTCLFSSSGRLQVGSFTVPCTAFLSTSDRKSPGYIPCPIARTADRPYFVLHFSSESRPLLTHPCARKHIRTWYLKMVRRSSMKIFPSIRASPSTASPKVLKFGRHSAILASRFRAKNSTAFVTPVTGCL